MISFLLTYILVGLLAAYLVHKKVTPLYDAEVACRVVVGWPVLIILMTIDWINNDLT